MPITRSRRKEKAGGETIKTSQRQKGGKIPKESDAEWTFIEAIDWGTQNVAMTYGLFHKNSSNERLETGKDTNNANVAAVRTLAFDDSEKQTLTALGLDEDGALEWGSGVSCDRNFRCRFENLKLASIEVKETEDLRQEHIAKLESLLPQGIPYIDRSNFRSLLGNSDKAPSTVKTQVQNSSDLATVFLSYLNKYALVRIADEVSDGHCRIHNSRRETGMAVPALTDPENVEKMLSIADKAGFPNVHIVSEPAAAALYLFHFERNENQRITSKGVTNVESWTLNNHQSLVIADVGHGTAVSTPVMFQVQSQLLTGLYIILCSVRDAVSGSGACAGLGQA